MNMEREYVWEFKGNLVHLSEREIYFVQLEQRVIYVHTRDCCYPIGRHNMKEEEEKLKEMPMIRTHYSYLVNMRYVQMLGKDEVIMRNGTHIPVSGNRKKEVRETVRTFFRDRKNCIKAE